MAKAFQSQNLGLALIAAGKAGPSFRLIAQDFPTAVREAEDGPGHDGQMIYAMARLPTRVEEAAPLLDRPRYRLQRPLFPWIAGILHPWGGGQGLVAVIFMLGVAACLSVGSHAAYSHTLSGEVEIAFLFPSSAGASRRCASASGMRWRPHSPSPPWPFSSTCVRAPRRPPESSPS